MIIRWNSSASDLAGLQPDLVRETVSELVRCYRRGHHLVTISRSTATSLLSLEGLSELEAVTLHRIRQEFTTYGNAHKQASVYLDVVASSVAALNRTGAAIQVTMPALVQSNFMDPSVLLIENLSRDGWFYPFAMKSLRDLVGCGQIKLELAHGGGADIPSVLSYLVSSKRIAVAIVDSDRHYPQSAKNEKLSSLNTVLKNSGCDYCFAFSPPCREVENLIPFEVVIGLKSALENDTNSLILKIGDEEVALGLPMADRYWLYFDPKDGLSPEMFAKRTAGERAWIATKLAIVGLDPEVSSVPGYGGRLIDQIMQGGEHVSHLRSTIRTKEWRLHFGDFINDIIWAFCSNGLIGT